MNSRAEIRARLESQLCHELGETILDALQLPDVSDVHVDTDGTLYTRRRGRWTTDQNVLYPPEHRETVIGLVAHSLHLEATSKNPVIEGEMEFGGRRFRFTGHLPPLVSGPTIYIRKPAAIVYTLAQYEDDRIITARQRTVLQQAVKTRRNILIAGGMGSGKSTLANALIGEIAPEMHVGIIEDTYELECRLPHRSHLHTTENMICERSYVRRSAANWTA
jgi:type IV secretion system protein VirB11